MDEEKIKLITSQNKLSCVLHLLINLTKLMDINNNVRDLIESTFIPIIYDLDGQVSKILIKTRYFVSLTEY